MRLPITATLLLLTLFVCESRGQSGHEPPQRAINFRKRPSDIERQLETVTPLGGSYSEVKAFLRRELPAHNQSNEWLITQFTDLKSGPLLIKTYFTARQRGSSVPEIGLSAIPTAIYRWPSPRWGKEWAEVGVSHVSAKFPAVPRGFFRERSSTDVYYSFDRRGKLLAIEVCWGRVARS